MQSPKIGILSRALNLVGLQKRTRASENDFFTKLFGLTSNSAIKSNEYTASTLTAIARAQAIISDGIADMSLKDYQTTPEGKTELVNSNVTELLREPINGMTNYTFRRLLTYWSVKYGNGLAYIIKDKTGAANGLIPILPENYRSPQYSNGQWYYNIFNPTDNKTYTLGVYDILHIRYNSEDGFWGRSPLLIHAQSLGISLNAEKYGLDYFQNGGKPAFYASTPAAIPEVSRKALQESLKETFAASNNGFAMLDNGLMLHTISANPSETQFAEVRAYGIAEASRIYGVPKYMLSDASDSSYTNSESEAIHFYTSTLMAHAINQEQEYSLKLYTEREKASGRYLKMNFNSLMRADSTTRAAFYQTLFINGVLNQDEIRAYEGLNKIPDNSGQTYYVQANLIPSNKMGEFYDAKVSVLIGQQLALEATNNNQK